MVAIALRVRPDVVTLVPERREERTTEGGLEVARNRDALAPKIARLRDANMKVSLFIGADRAQIEASHAIGAQQIELHTGPYSHARVGSARRIERTLLAQAARVAHERGLEVAAGHGLTRANVVDVAAIPEIQELNIGHALVADAVILGMRTAVRSMRAAIARGIRRRPTS
jgi:pyridoxine 5-phosphate synthase